ncbi:hypothetical protein [Streptomyces sp. NPDC058412]|uniref:hypothetical protein n=1 Tax=Streptomyces sp. NPDC058412 TaxID=3346486 RepID=UPI003649F02E
MIPRIVDVSIAGLFQNPPTCDAAFAVNGVNGVNDLSVAMYPFMSLRAGYMLFATPTSEFVVADAAGAVAVISAVAMAPTANAFRTRRITVLTECGPLRARLDPLCMCYS